MDRRVTIFICKPFDLVNGSQYYRLDDIAAGLFAFDSIVENDLVNSYRQRILDTNISLGDMDSYEKVFKKYYFEINIRSLVEQKWKDGPSEFHFDKECGWLKNALDTDELVKGDTFRITPINNRIRFFQVFMLDSVSLHLSATSKIESNQLSKVPFLTVIPKHKKLLSDPYKPSCVKRKNYKQHECYQDCFNDLIESKFKCRVLFGRLNNSSKYCEPWLIPLIKNYEKYVLKNSYSDTCVHCKEPCEFYYYDLEKDYSNMYTNRITFVLSPSLHRIDQFVVITFEETVLIVISYLSLFYGGSLLAIVQLLYNYLSSKLLIKRMSEFQFNCFKNMKIIDLFSKFRTIHCAKYLSSENRNDLRKIFWAFMITIALTFGIFILVLEFSKYTRSPNINELSVSDNKQINWPKMHICRNTYNTHHYLKEIINQNVLDAFANLHNSLFHQLQLEFYLQNLSYENLTKNLVNRYHSSKASQENLFEKLDNNKWSGLIEAQEKSFFGSIETSNGAYFESKLEIYQFSILHENDLNRVLCKTVNVKDIEHNPFVSTKTSLVSFLFKNEENFLDYDIFLNDFILSSQISRKIGISDLKRIKSILNDFDYKTCKNDKTKCVFNKKILKKYSENQLFLCNDQVKEMMYNVFNCTPFLSTTTRVPECSLAYSILIQDIMLLFKKDFFKCEISMPLYPIQYESMSLPLQNDVYSAGVDLNVVQIFEQNIKEEYDLFKLIMNISNMLNVLIGFSFITICELVFIFIHFYFSSLEKVSFIQSK